MVKLDQDFPRLDHGQIKLAEDGGIEPLHLTVLWFSRPVAVHSAASSLDQDFQDFPRLDQGK